LQVQPDIDELSNGLEKDDEKKLGKLQFSLDYDFTQNNVRKYIAFAFCRRLCIYWRSVKFLVND